MVKYPTITITMPCFNRAENLEKFLKNITRQTYPRECLEILIADGCSTDQTVEIAEKYGCTIIQDDTPDLEKRRKMGIEAAKGEFIFIVDDDNFFPNEKLLVNMMDALLTEGAYAAECVWQFYDPKDYPMNRYCSLYGTYDPATYYLRRNDHMSIVDQKWTLGGNVVKENNDYFKIRFQPGEVPTMGGQGFLCEKKYIQGGVVGDAVMHMDICAKLVEEGKNEFIFMKDYFGHDCVTSKKQLVQKLKRNIIRYNAESSQRTMNYDMGIWKMVKLGLVMGTFIIPFKDALTGYIKKPDVAWFLHPVLSFEVACCYTWNTIANVFKKS